MTTNQKSEKLAKTPQRFRLVTDNDGHDYIILEGEEIDFYLWVEASENGDDFDGKDYNSRRVNNSGWTFIDPQGY